jgi:hypothetical protein
MGRGFIAALLAMLLALATAACGGGDRDAGSPQGDPAAAPVEAGPATTIADAAPTTAPARIPTTRTSEPGGQVVARSNKAACKVLTQPEMSAILGQPVEAISFKTETADTCGFGAEPTSPPVNQTIPYYVYAGLQLLCGSSATTMHQTWYLPPDSTRAPGARHDIRISKSVAPYFLMLPNACAALVTPVLNIRPYLNPDGTIKPGTAEFPEASKRAVVAALDAAYDRLS